MPITTKEAFDTLKSALQTDAGYAWSWHCSIAMAIYDESHPVCVCEILDGEYKGHRPECASVRAHDARHFNEHALSGEFCNNAAARFMKLCFDVDTSGAHSRPSHSMKGYIGGKDARNDSDCSGFNNSCDSGGCASADAVAVGGCDGGVDRRDIDRGRS